MTTSASEVRLYHAGGRKENNNPFQISSSVVGVHTELGTAKLHATKFFGWGTTGDTVGSSFDVYLRLECFSTSTTRPPDP
jgi:hypothetical protein